MSEPKHTAGEFTITAYRHPAGPSREFPDGVFYGQVDGRGCTAPCYSESAAIAGAEHQLWNGGLAATLKTSIQCMEGWVRTGFEVEKTKVKIESEKALLEKVEAAIAKAQPEESK